jgi:hypothetical protein
MKAPGFAGGLLLTMKLFLVTLLAPGGLALLPLIIATLAQTLFGNCTTTFHQMFGPTVRTRCIVR